MIESRIIKKVLRAFESKDVGSIESLVVQGVNPNLIIPTKGVCLLHLIIGHQSESFAFRVTKLFLRHGGDPNIQSSDGVTPTHVAAAWGRNRILHLLLVNGGNPWLQDEEKKNAFNYAFEEREWSTIEMLHHFQQMHSSTYSKQDGDLYPKFELDLERVLLRKGEEMFAYTPTKKSMKSIMTQTQSDLSDTPSSPVQDIIRYFESPVPSASSGNCQKETENINIGWVKDFYQSSCEVLVHCDNSRVADKEQNKETFVSCIHIETSTQDSNLPEKKTTNNHPSLDIRSQLFLELQEAVRKRSRLKKVQHNEQNVNLKSLMNFDSVLKSPVEKESGADNEISYLYGVNFKENQMLKNMSDFATKVMKEIEVRREEPELERTIDLCYSSPELTNYVSCDDEPPSSKFNETFQTTQNKSDCSNVYLTPYNSNIGDEVIRENSKAENSNDSFVSISEEYKYTDVEEGVVLLEKKFLPTPTISVVTSMTEKEDEEEEGRRGESKEDDDDVSIISSNASTLPTSLSYNSDILRCELTSLGYNPGPVTKTTKKLYLKKLWRLKKEAKVKGVFNKGSVSNVCSTTLDKTLTSLQRFEEIPTYRKLEEEMCLSFENWTRRKWREGKNKTSFNYLLLDPRISQNLPKRASGLPAFDAWKCFLSAVFYIGKGKRSRPYAHLYEATAFWEKRTALNQDDKVQRIIDIWKEGLGVVCLQVYQNIIPVEAFTREAAMIDAMGLSNLKNSKAGEYYGIASTWPKKEKINLGIYLLHKAMLIFLNEGERQIKPYDID